MDKKEVPIRLTVSPATRKKLRELAGKHDMSMAAFVRQLVEKAVKEPKNGKE